MSGLRTERYLGQALNDDIANWPQAAAFAEKPSQAVGSGLLNEKEEEGGGGEWGNQGEEGWVTDLLITCTSLGNMQPKVGASHASAGLQQHADH